MFFPYDLPYVFPPLLSSPPFQGRFSSPSRLCFEALLVGLVFRLVELGDLGGVEELREHAVLEELLLAALHLHQELLTVLVLAVHVEYGAVVGLARAQMFGVQVGQFLDL